MININSKSILVEDCKVEINTFFNSILNSVPRIEITETLYFFSHKLGTFFFQSDESYSLSVLQIQDCQKTVFQGLHFFKINKSYWVNLEHAVGILQHGTRNYCELTNGELLFISKSNLVAFQKLVSLKHATKYN